MDKEIQMFNKIALSALLVCGTAALTACGEGALKRESNPTAAYEDNVLQNTQAWNPASYAEQEAKRQAEALKPCGNPFTLAIEGERAKIATFTEEKEKTITIKVTSTLEEGMPWDLKLVVSPCKDNNCFKQVSKSQQEGVYTFTYTPDKLALKNDQAFDFLQFKYEWNLENRCAVNTSITETVALIINRAKSAAETKAESKQEKDPKAKGA